MADCSKKQALVRSVEIDCRAGIASFEESIFGIEDEAAFDLLGCGVALVTAFDEDGPNFIFEMVQIPFIGKGHPRGDENGYDEPRCHGV